MKLGALVLAIFLWFYVGIEQNPFVERQFNVPVNVENVPEGLKATPAQKTVNVLVRERQDRMNAIQAGHFTASIDMANAPLGQSTYPVKVRSTGMILRSVRVVPKEMAVTLVQASGISLPLEVRTVGQAPPDVPIGAPVLSSDLVYISGPEETLNKITRAGVEVNLSGIRETTVSPEEITLYDTGGQVLAQDGLTLNPSQVLVTLPVNSQLVEKSVPISPTTVGQPAEGFYLTRATPEPQTVVLVGEEEVLAKIKRIETIPVDISGSMQNKKESTTLNLPPRVSVQGSTQVDVSLQFGSDPNVGTQNLDLAIEISGQPELGEAKLVDIDQVRITYQAQTPPAEVQKLLRAMVDVSGLGPGRHELAVTILSESKDRLQVERMTPTTVTVIIE